MKRDEQAVCVNMFNHVLHWTKLPNNERGVGERRQILCDICEIVGSNTNRIDELCLQILKQTRGQMKPMLERNTWKLFHEVINRRTPSAVSTHPCTARMWQCPWYMQELLQFLIRCFKSVEARSAEDPFVRRTASELTTKLMALLPLDAEERTRPPSLDQMCESTYSCKVFLMDGKHQDVIYDSHTLVEHVVPQVSWAIGLENCKTYGLFELWRDKHVQLNKKRHLITVVNSPRFLNGGREETSKLLMKKKIIRSLDEERKDTKGFELTYAQAKVQYLQSEYPLDDTQAIRLCTLLIQIEHPTAFIEDEEELFKAVEEFIPRHVRLDAT